MKRLITVILILIVLVSSAYADNSAQLKWNKRFITLTDEELSDANIALQKILFDRKASADGVLVPAGTYIVGEDIPAGVYRIEYTKKVETDFCTFCAANEKTYFSFTTMLGVTGASEIGKIELTDGTTIQISYGDVCFFTYTGLFH